MLTMGAMAQVKQPEGNGTECGVSALLPAVDTLLRLPQQGKLLPATNKR